MLSEKPFASNAAEALEVHEAATAAGVKVADGFHNVFHPAFRRLQQVLSTGELGRVEQVEAAVIAPAPAHDDVRWSYELAGGALMDLGCYSLHAVRTLGEFCGGEPELEKAVGGERTGRPGVDEWATAELRYPSGASASARCHMSADSVEMSLRVVGSRGEATLANFVLCHLDDRLTVRTEAGERVEHLGTRTTYTYQLEAFTAYVREGARMATDSADAVATMRLIDQVYDAIGLGPRPRSG